MWFRAICFTLPCTAGLMLATIFYDRHHILGTITILAFAGISFLTALRSEILALDESDEPS